MKLILGSASRWRRELLKKAGLIFDVMAADIDERQYNHDDPEQFVLTIAKAKADALLPQIDEPSFLITLDQTVVCNGHYHNKPESADEVRLFLQRYAEHPAITYTGVIVTNTQTGEQVSGVDVAKVYFKPLPNNILEAVIRKGDIFDCAGAFQVEGDALFQPYIIKIDGALNSVQGLPLNLVKKLLTDISIAPE